MTTRTRTTTVTFTRPFHLDEVDQELPAGAYSVETEEETLDSLSFVAWRRVSTHITIGLSNGSRMYMIDPASLDHALALDQAPA